MFVGVLMKAVLFRSFDLIAMDRQINIFRYSTVALNGFSRISTLERVTYFEQAFVQLRTSFCTFYFYTLVFKFNKAFPKIGTQNGPPKLFNWSIIFLSQYMWNVIKCSYFVEQNWPKKVCRVNLCKNCLLSVY